MDAPVETELLNICVTPPPDIAARCVSLSANLASPETILALNGTSRFPHLTLYMARFPIAARALVVTAVEDALDGRAAFACAHEGFSMTDGGYGEASFKKTDELQDLHENMISVLKDFRYSPEQAVVESYFGAYTDAQKGSANATGYDLAHALYRPHITLARYVEGKALSNAEFVRQCTGSSLSFTANTVCVYKADDNGAVFDRLAAFELEPGS